MSVSPINQELPTVVRGNDWHVSATLTAGVDNDLWPIPESSTVKAAFVDVLGMQSYTQTVNSSIALSGSSWSDGIIKLEFSCEDTLLIPAGVQLARLEVLVSSGIDTSWFAVIRVDSSLVE